MLLILSFRNLLLLLLFSLSQLGSAQALKYLGEWDSNGVPYYLNNDTDIISNTTLANIFAVLPERTENLTYVDYNNYLNIKLDTATRIWISMITEGAGNKNTLTYYTYIKGDIPSSTDNIDSLTVIFPNASMVGSGGGLHKGDKVYLDSFTDNTEIAFCLLTNAYDKVTNTISNSHYKYFTNFNLNPEKKDTLKAHNVVFWDNSVKKYVLGFEDLKREWTGCDHDFNDCLFYITMDPLPPFARENNTTPTSAPPTLPVELVNFEATYSNSNIILNWVTASEYNNKGFEIQRANNGFDFETIGYEKGNGNANLLIRYTFVDTKIEEGETYYYRLKQIDYDGQFKYSNFQTVQIAPSKLMLSAYPNPVGNGDIINFKLSSDNKGGNGRINFYSIDGQLIFSKDIIYFGLKYYDQINTQGMKSGMYILEYINNFQTIQNKVIIR